MRWFRFSLLSLVVAVVVAGAFLWANMTTHGPWYQHGWGWPRQYWYWSDFGTFDASTGEANHYYFDSGALLIDVAIALAATLLAGASVEWAVRRYWKARDRSI